MGSEKRFCIWVVASRGFNGIQDRVTLADGKRRNPQRIARGFACMRHHRFRHRAGFFRIGASAARIKAPVNAPQGKPKRGRTRTR